MFKLLNNREIKNRYNKYFKKLFCVRFIQVYKINNFLKNIGHCIHYIYLITQVIKIYCAFSIDVFKFVLKPIRQ